MAVDKIRYEEMTWEEIGQIVKEGRVPLLPVGSVEDHGPHLQLSTDVFIPYTICVRAAERIPNEAVVLPPVYYGFNEHHMDFSGTIAVDWDHFINYVFDIGKSLARHGFKKIIIVDGHGSNVPFLDIVARRITNETPAVCAMAPWWNLAADVINKVRESEFPGGMAHACELETSAWLYLKPGAVYKDKIQKEISFPKSKYLYWDLSKSSGIYFMDWWSRMSKTGVIGDPTKATAGKGKQIVSAAVENLVGFVKEFRTRRIRKRIDYHPFESAAFHSQFYSESE